MYRPKFKFYDWHPAIYLGMGLILFFGYMFFTSSRPDPWENQGHSAGVVEKVVFDAGHSRRTLIAHIRLENGEQLQIKLEPKDFVREGSEVRVNIAQNTKTNDYKYNVVMTPAVN